MKRHTMIYPCLPLVLFTLLLFTASGPPPAAAQVDTSSPLEKTESAPTPLTQEAIANCPVTVPEIFQMPDGRYNRRQHRNDDDTLRTTLPIDGKVIVDPNGTLGAKWPWWRYTHGSLAIDGRRLDAPAPPLQAYIPDGYGEYGFHASGIEFSSQGCWEVTGRVEDAHLTFVVLVVQIPFPARSAAWLPQNLLYQDTDLTNSPHSITRIYGFGDGRSGELIVETTPLDHAALPSAQTTPPLQTDPLVQGERVCVQGARDEAAQRWDYDADATMLVWRLEGYEYRFSQRGLGLDCADLMLVAVGVPRPQHRMPLRDP